MTAEKVHTFGEYRAQPHFGTTLSRGWDAWELLAGQNRDSDILTRANWAEMCEGLQKECGDECNDPDDDDGGQWAILRFNHWACGWVEHIFTRPGSRASELGADWRRRMESYPVLNEERWGNMEQDEYGEAWEDWGASQFRGDIRRELAECECGAVMDWLDDVPTADELRDLYEELRTSGEFHTFDNGGCVIHTRHAARDLTRAQLAGFVRKVRAARAAPPAAG